MNTPIRNFVAAYQQKKTSRLHMPGHKGTGPLGCESMDITEIQGADALYEAAGVIAESERNASALFLRSVLLSLSHFVRAIMNGTSLSIIKSII